MYYRLSIPSRVKIINDTATHTGRFGKIVALQDSVINTLVAENITGGFQQACSLNQPLKYEGVITSVKFAVVL